MNIHACVFINSETQTHTATCVVMRVKSPESLYSLCVEVHEHGQLAVDDPLREVVLVLDIEGDPPAEGVRKGARGGA